MWPLSPIAARQVMWPPPQPPAMRLSLLTPPEADEALPTLPATHCSPLTPPEEPAASPGRGAPPAASCVASSIAVVVEDSMQVQQQQQPQTPRPKPPPDAKRRSGRWTRRFRHRLSGGAAVVATPTRTPTKAADQGRADDVADNSTTCTTPLAHVAKMRGRRRSSIGGCIVLSSQETSPRSPPEVQVLPSAKGRARRSARWAIGALSPREAPPLPMPMQLPSAQAGAKWALVTPRFNASEVAALIGLHCYGEPLHALLRCWRRFHMDSFRRWERTTGGVALPEVTYARHASRNVHAAVAEATKTGDGAMPKMAEERIAAAVRSSGAPAELVDGLVQEALGRARCGRGTRLERSGIDAYEKMFGRKVVRRNKDALRGSFGTGLAAFLLCGRVDGVEEEGGQRFVVEHKRRQRRLFKHVPDYEVVQCQVASTTAPMTTAAAAVLTIGGCELGVHGAGERGCMPLGADLGTAGGGEAARALSAALGLHRRAPALLGALATASAARWFASWGICAQQHGQGERRAWCDDANALVSSPSGITAYPGGFVGSSASVGESGQGQKAETQPRSLASPARCQEAGGGRGARVCATASSFAARLLRPSSGRGCCCNALRERRGRRCDDASLADSTDTGSCACVENAECST
eukprot:TRINITY_DN25563_c1_g2_i1.p1 TRINITY_DN25563_c1_g2~~TRINITY_DN25563_c1_g2_i1.p1  ORF type:complete len:640 (-),score=122.38 TRINITY_DN25563_c1_g2_i1:227-2146(-)